MSRKVSTWCFQAGTIVFLLVNPTFLLIALKKSGYGLLEIGNKYPMKYICWSYYTHILWWSWHTQMLTLLPESKTPTSKAVILNYRPLPIHSPGYASCFWNKEHHHSPVTRVKHRAILTIPLEASSIPITSSSSNPITTAWTGLPSGLIRFSAGLTGIKLRLPTVLLPPDISLVLISPYILLPDWYSKAHICHCVTTHASKPSKSLHCSIKFKLCNLEFKNGIIWAQYIF